MVKRPDSSPSQYLEGLRSLALDWSKGLPDTKKKRQEKLVDDAQTKINRKGPAGVLELVDASGQLVVETGNALRGSRAAAAYPGDVRHAQRRPRRSTGTRSRLRCRCWHPSSPDRARGQIDKPYRRYGCHPSMPTCVPLPPDGGNCVSRWGSTAATGTGRFNMKSAYANGCRIMCCRVSSIRGAQ
jgi:hypothetical protein